MKVRSSVKRMCEHCKIIRRAGNVRIICKNPPSISNGRADKPGILNQASERSGYGTYCRNRPPAKQEELKSALTYIFGIGRAPRGEILGRDRDRARDTRVADLTDAEPTRLRGVIERDFKVEGALRTEISMNIKRLMDIGCYRGMRHRR